MTANTRRNTLNLLSLPTELLTILPNYLYSLDDLYSLLRTCRTLYKTCANSKVKCAPDFAKRHGLPPLPPHPHLLLTGTARQIGDWAVQSEANRQELTNAMQRGNPGLLQLAIDVARLSLEDVRRIYKNRLDIINPVSRRMDWNTVRRRQHREGNEADWTICEDVEQAVYNYIIYCELFHHCVDKMLEPSLPIEPLSAEVRQSWVGYCFPDANKECTQVEHSMQLFNFLILSEAWVAPNKITQFLFTKSRDDGTFFNGLSLQGKLFVCAMAHQGLATVQMLLPGGVESIKDLTTSVREMADAVPSTWILSRRSDIGWFLMSEDVTAGMCWHSVNGPVPLRYTVPLES